MSNPAGQRAPPKRHGRRWLLAGIALLVAGGVAALGIIQREDTVTALADTANDESVPKVMLVLPKHGPASRTLTLPGQTQAWYQAPIFAQVTGYVQTWYKDYGAVVKKGDLLATIATPNLDQELQQARAQLDVAKTRYSLAHLTAQRSQKLAGTRAVSQETVDVNIADARAAQAAVQAAQFNVASFEAQEAFKRVVAPFDGVATARFTDIGNYVNASGGNAEQGGSRELFAVSDIHEIRIFVSVPQDYSAYINPGLSASITLAQFPSRTFTAIITTLSKAFAQFALAVERCHCD
jgi:membrane fusion protein (multidrug efflux system)